MLKRFFPQVYVDSIYDIAYEELLKQNIKGLIFDIDNTLAPFDVPTPDDRLIKFIQDLQQKGFKICLLSNNKQHRVDTFNSLKLPAVAKAGKPKLTGVKTALSMLGTDSNNTVIIGDQVFTDVWCGNRMHMYTILVKPIAIRDEFTVKLKRGLEKIVIKIYMAKNKD